MRPKKANMLRVISPAVPLPGLWNVLTVFFLILFR